MNLPKNAIDFIAFMEDVWRMELRPTAEGIQLDGHPHYNILHHAIRTARECGAGRTGGTLHNGQRAHVFRFPGDRYGVIIGYDGSWCCLGKRVYGEKSRR